MDLAKQKTYYQIFGIRRPYRDYKMLDEFVVCPLCHIKVQLCRVGMMRDFRFNWKRCSVCLVKIPLPKYIVKYLARRKPKPLPSNQLTFDGFELN